MTNQMSEGHPWVTRVEVIDSTGRAFTAYYETEGVYTQVQDNGRTLKIFAGERRDPSMRVCGDHNPVQHRDMKPPWCNKCGRDASGQMQRKEQEA